MDIHSSYSVCFIYGSYSSSLYGIYYSFTTWDGINPEQFNGIKNYLKLFNDTSFFEALWFTTKFAVVSIIVINFLGLSLALLVNNKK